MPTVQNIYDYIGSVAPFSLADPKGDNVGLLVGDGDAKIERVLLALDITKDVVGEAKRKNMQLVVSHHPVIFRPLSEVTPQSPVYQLIEGGIHAICAHTNADMAKGGLSDIMADMLELTPREVLEVKYPVQYGAPMGYGKICVLEQPISPDALARRVKEVFGCTVVRYTRGSKKEVRTVAVCSGAGGSNIALAAKCGCDAYVTGDIKHDQLVDANNLGLCVIDGGHYHTEITFVKWMQRLLTKAFPNLTVEVAESATDPATYIL